ncbi:stearoyl-CoA 9-desaturase [Kytococcus schroeteri]|uniref:Stearoyl-CoA 9-desaturase n=1 Tax=Kytococcus schroeteri TaxID=138300 RepID=A0A2I1P9R4_9MICO|nr:ferredoxin reductase [Kytococcus schroeteri]PKZ41377.1 stearoyl-CoA 9-desaturase [Kytococcus schroeteri]
MSSSTRRVTPRPAWVDRLIEAAAVVTTPVVPHDYVDMVAPLQSRVSLVARVERVHHDTARTVSLWLRPGVLWKAHRPGQYVRIGVDVDGVRHWRTYSLTSKPAPAGTPGDAGLLQITVTQVPDGLVSTHLVRNTKVGDLLHLDAADGEFTLDDPRPGKILFLGAGSGITPIMGLLRGHKWHGPDAPDVVVVQSARTPAERLFAEELPAIADRFGLRLITRHTATEGRFGLDELDTEVPDWRERTVWACGPAGMLDDCEEFWEDAGLRHQLLTERFRTVEITPGEGGLATFATGGSETEVETDGSTTLLDAGEEAGLLLPSGCRMGICHSCVLNLTEGAVRDLRDGSLTLATPEDPALVQTCVTTAAGDCHLEVPA